MRNQFIEDKDKGFIVRKKINEDFLKLFIYTDTPFLSSNNLTLNYLPKYNNDHALINSVVYDDGSNVGIGTNSPISKLEVVGENIVGYSNASNSHTGIVVRNNNNASWTIDGRLIVDTVNTPNKVIIGSWTNHPLQIITNNTQRMWVDSWGVSTTGNLSVSGDVIISGSLSALGDITRIETRMYTTSSVNIRNSGSDTALIVKQTGTQDIATFFDDNDVILSLKDGGNVGIGTSTSVNEKLTVAGGNISIDDNYGLKWSANTDTASIRFESTWDNAGFSKLILETTDNEDEPIVLRQSGLDRLYVGTGGNVGIGTSAPNEKLTVIGSISAVGNDISNTFSNTDTPAFGGLKGFKLINKDTSQDSVGGILSIIADPNGITQHTGAIVFGRDGTWTSTNYPGYVSLWTRPYDSSAEVEHMRIDSTGNVGIGTTTPGVKLDVAGTIAANYLRLDASDGVAEGGEIQLKGAGTYGDLQIDNHSGNLRLHTLNTGNHFQILGGHNTTALRVEDGGVYIGSFASGNTNSVIIESSGTLQKRSIDSRVWGTSLVDGTGTANRVAYWTGSNTIAANSNFFFDGTNVGIGNTDPTGALDVTGNAYFNKGRIGGSNHVTIRGFQAGMNYGVLAFTTSGPNGNTDVNIATISGLITSHTVGSESGGFTFSTLNAGVASEKMRLDPSGSLGIGITPTQKLHVVESGDGGANGTALFSSAGSNASIRIDSASTSYHAYQTFSQGGVGKFELGIDNASDFYINPTVQFSSNGAAIYIKKSDGNVGIGAITPNEKLTIVGNLSATGTGTFKTVNANTTSNDVLVLGADNKIEKRTLTIWNAGSSGLLGNSLTTNYITKYSGTNTVSNSLIYDNGTDVGIGTTSPINYANYTTLTIIGTNGGAITLGRDNANRSEWGDTSSETYFKNIDSSRRLWFGTSNAERMTILPAGNVGVGQTNPYYNLEVIGSTLARPSSQTLFGEIVAGDALYVDVTNPGAGTTNWSGTLLRQYGKTATGTSFGVSNAGLGMLLFQNTENCIIGTNSSSLPLIFANGNGEKMRIASDGNVGIGSSAHMGYGKLSIVDGSAAGITSQIFIGPVDGGLGRESAISFGATFSNGWGGADFAQRVSGKISYGAYNASADPRDWSMKFFTGDAVTGSDTPTERMRINSSGNVGINKTNPTYMLDVLGGQLGGTLGNTMDLARFGNYNSNANFLRIYQRRFATGVSWNTAETRIQQTTDTTDQTYISFSPDGDGGMAFGTGSGFLSEKMRIQSGGNVGIGTTAPSEKLTVSGNIGATGNVYTSEGGFVRNFNMLYDACASKLHSQIGQDINGEAASDQSGWSVSMNAAGDRVAIGAPYNDGNGNSSGHVRIYSLIGTAWTQLGSVDINGEASEDRSGYSVSMNAAGDRVAIGSYLNDGGGFSSGRVGIYSWNGSTWGLLAEINGETSSDQSGMSVSMNAAGDRVAIGAPYNDGNGFASGHVRIYYQNGLVWPQLGSVDIDGEAASDESGYSVSMNAAGDRVAIGAPFNDANGTNYGHVRIYSWNGTAWTKLGSVDIDGEAIDNQSGMSVSMNAAGDRVAIGAPFNDGGGTSAGHVRIYSWNGAAWTKLGLDIDGETSSDQSGWSVSMNAAGDRVAIGAKFNDGNGSSSGHVRIYHINDNDPITPKIRITETVEITKYGSSDPALTVGGKLSLRGLPTYSNNTTAKAGGLIIDDVYKTSTGELRIVI